MELIRISDHKLKIMLTPSDMRHFELNAESLEEDGERMHKGFRSLLGEVRRQTDFSGDESRISVRYFPSREGGCEMFISYSPSEGENAPLLSGEDAEKTSLLPHPSSGGFLRECAYRFSALPDLLSACQRLAARGFHGESQALCDEQGQVYLLFSVLSASPFSLPEELDFLAEYGSVENAARLKLYIEEHGRVFCPSSAVETLGALA